MLHYILFYLNLLFGESASAETASCKTLAAEAHDKSNSSKLWDHFSHINSRHALVCRSTLQPKQNIFLNSF